MKELKNSSVLSAPETVIAIFSYKSFNLILNEADFKSFLKMVLTFIGTGMSLSSTSKSPNEIK